MRKLPTLIVLVAAMCLVVSCSGHDSDYFPYAMKGLNAWVYLISPDPQP